MLGSSNGVNAEDKSLREPLIIINLLLPQMGESSDVKSFWIPAFAGMTFLEVALSMFSYFSSFGFRRALCSMRSACSNNGRDL